MSRYTENWGRLGRITPIAAAVLLALASPARAAMPVVDFSALARWGQQLQAMAQQLQSLRQQYTMAEEQFQSFNHMTSMGSILPMLQSPMLSDPLPGAQGDIQGLLGGLGGGGPLAGLEQQNYQRDTIYAPPGNTWQDQRIIQQGHSIAGAQAVSQQLYQSAADRIPYMQQLVQQIGTSTDPKTTMDLQARLQGEEAIVQTQQVQAETLSTWYTAQIQSQRQQDEEKRQEQIDEVMAEAKANGINVGQ